MPRQHQTNIYVDGFNLYYGCLKDTPYTDARRLLLVKPPKIGSKFANVWKTEEKGSDVNLASYLLMDTFKGDCDTAVVISNDADLKKPIEIAMREDVKVGVVNPHPPKKRSRDLKPTFFKQIRESAIRQCQFPTTLQDSRGTIHKPSTW